MHLILGVLQNEFSQPSKIGFEPGTLKLCLIQSYLSIGVINVEIKIVFVNLSSGLCAITVMRHFEIYLENQKVLQDLIARKEI